jgi:hypothetical protein
MNVTQWFSMRDAPINIGVYQVIDRFNMTWFSLWNGAQWCLVNFHFENASKATCQSVDCYGGFIVGWRGMLK